ncbi:uncharacterized protein LOC106875063 [Octopus bimaculoides]|uniref:Uncharacterized protein n=1 Tax=Octopus bimaculoides TaxID=37653 RepID=A0A0L8GRX0_OCTBM|nr:uncharacterized protein LOC106875063 [Octopus bimaculoides]|eukprot:XP_014778511.1 PREDICTED: uncharacterized protein LOC106875063 [Octopus bimaculoides]
MVSLQLQIYLCVLLSINFAIGAEVSDKGVKCQKVKELGDRPPNVYYCPEPEKPRCCQPEGGVEYTCCEEKTTEDLKNQFELWVYIFIVVGVVVILCFYFFKDVNYCSLKQPLKNYLCKKSNPSAERQLYFNNPMFEEGTKGTQKNNQY